MKFRIRPWRYGKLALVTEQGGMLACFSSVAQALKACEEWYRIDNRSRIDRVQRPGPPPRSSRLNCE